MRAGAIIPAEKTCKCCHLLLPITKFDKKPSNRDGFKKKCRSCSCPEKAVSHKRWVEKNRERLNAYASQYYHERRKEVLKDRPAPVPCHCGNTENFHWQRNQWYCAMPACTKARKRKSKSNRKRSSEARLRHAIRNKCKRLCARYGEPMAVAFRALMSERASVRVPLWKIIRRSLPSDYQQIGEQATWRIELLNLVSLKPVWHIGWDCKDCELHSVDHRFFDIDHVLPKCKQGHDCVENMQVLCPNCHRNKTNSDLRERHGSVIPKQLDPPAQDHWQAGTVTTIDAGAESCTLPTASTTSLSQL